MPLNDEDVDSMTVFEFSDLHKTTVVLDGQFIKITRRGFANVWFRGFAGEKAINISDITAVQLRKPGKMSGYLQFSLPGAIESTRDKQGNRSATRDENAITFGIQELKYAVRIKNYVEERISSGNFSNYSTADEIIKYKQLLDAGTISQAEFETAKQKLLNK